MRDDNKLHREKRYVEVDVRFTPDGKIRPLAINYDKSHIYGIDRVLAVGRGTSRLGGKGQCFTCMICGQKRNGKILFGEMTFFHWSGLMPFEPEEWDYKFGSWIELPEVR